MPCACDQCLQHAKTLGLPPKGPAKPAIRRAFRAAANRWHPDRFENQPAKRNEAEEKFKLIQVAYRELWEHCENPAKPSADPTRQDPPPPEPTSAEAAFAGTPRNDGPPAISFDGAPGCFTAAHFPPQVREIIGGHLQDTERALAFIDLSAAGRLDGVYREYMLLTSYRIYVRDTFHVISLLWYTDLGEIRFIDRREPGNSTFWERIVENLSGIEQRYSLEINRHTGARFYTITNQADDSVKKVVYNFLRQMKTQPRS